MPKADSEIVEQLVVRAQAGDRAAYSKLVRMMMNQVVALTYKMTGDRDAAMDLAQETFISAWEKLGSFRRDARFESWLYRIATNKSLNYLERPSVKHTMSIDGEFSEVSPGAELMTSSSNPELEFRRKRMREEILDFMGQLPPQQRAVFNLRFYKQMSFEEIAEAIDKAVGTVKTHYREAVRKLRELALTKGWR